MNFDEIISALTPEVYERFKVAISTRKWPNGARLTPEQLETCMNAVIAYEFKHVPEHERIGYVPPKNTPCDTPDDAPSANEETPIKWKDNNE